MQRGELIIPLTTLIFLTSYLIYTLVNHYSNLSVALPYFLISLLLLLLAATSYPSLRASTRRRFSVKPPRIRVDVRSLRLLLINPEAYRPTSILLLTLAYLYLIEHLGFILTTMLYLVLSMLLMGLRKPHILLALTVGLTFALFLLFGIIFYIPLPRGVVERLVEPWIY